MAAQSSSTSDFGSLIQKNIRVLAESIKSSSSLPVGSARNNFNVCFPKFNEEMKPYSDQVLSMLSMLLMKEGIRTNVEHCDSEEKVDLVVDGVNKILDRVRDHLNVLNGIKDSASANDPDNGDEKNISGSWNRDLKKPIVWKANQPEQVVQPIYVQKVLEKPQTKFELKVDNSNAPFKPQLENKPHAVKPLAIYLETSPSGVHRYCHPYMHELNVFRVPQCQLEKVEPILPVELDSSYAVFVDNEETLASLVEDLNDAKELAIDLEYHNYRSFQGFTCVLQISTRKVDYIIDTLALRSKLQVLNKFFANPNVVKVLHGATSDVIWMQKDLNLYLVNMFDTHLASLALDFPRLSLAFLLKHYCNVEADKRYQLYDWRIRPLPEAALKYARSDTHYLLYIYDQLRNALIEKANGLTNLLQSVYLRSTDLCKKRYEKTFDENGYYALYKQSKQTFDNRQMHALKLLYEWRDQIAREKDESTGFVLPNHMLLQIAEILPREMQGILACCNPIPIIVRQNLSHLHKLIMEARHQPINKMISRQDRESITINQTPALSKLRCPHDFSYHDDFRDNLSTVLDGTDLIDVSGQENELRLSVLDDIRNTMVVESKDEAQNRVSRLRCVTFISPYERYRRTVQFVITQVERDDRGKEKLADEPDQVGNDDSGKDLDESALSAERFQARVPEPSPVPPNVSTSNCKFSTDAITPTSANASTYIEQAEPVRGSKRKQKTLSDQVSNKKVAHDYEIVRDAVRLKSAALESENRDIPSLEKEVENLSQMHVDGGKSAQTNKKRGIKSGRRNPRIRNDVQQKFVPFDYVNATYSKFVTTGPKNLKKLLNSKISFGANKKKKNQKCRKQKK